MAKEQIKLSYCEALLDHLWINGIITLEERNKIKEDVAKAFSL